MEVIYRPSKRGFCKPKKGSVYADHTYKTFLGFLKDGLRHIRLPNGRILTKYDWIDEYLEKFEVTEAEIHPSEKVDQHIGALKQR